MIVRFEKPRIPELFGMQVGQGHQSGEIVFTKLDLVGQYEIDEEAQAGRTEPRRVVVPLKCARASRFDVETMPVQSDLNGSDQVSGIISPSILMQPILHIAPRMELILPVEVIERVG